jgi:hypothetical protein
MVVFMAVTLAAGLAACVTGEQEPKIVSGSDGQVSIVTDLEHSPKPLALAHCAKRQKRPVLRDTTSAKDNLVRGWATGTKVFVYTFDCR